MEKKRVDFEEIYDIFAIRIIIDTPQEEEKEECFKIYSLITSLFHPNPERFRDWITVPKANGYESIHTTVMTPSGRWVEVQIRSKRMDIIAEKGMAAHFLYKEGLSKDDVQANVADNWLAQIREILEHNEKNALDFVDYFKQSLYTKEIYLFTPKGKMITLPAGSTVIDFAFAIHTQLGLSCMGAKVNSKVVSNKYELKSGEQVQILSSRKMTPEEIQAVSDIVNEAIQKDIEVKMEEMPVEAARESGAIGVFGNKYGETVKVYTIDGYSKEICGGPHAQRTGELKGFKILKEESSSAGVRRIKAVILDK
jgi:GTP pyrophosphokinase